jgi:transcriptional regulator with PAS, ATPase and Fis domain
MQVKLLRFLQERAYEPVGSSETRRADVRIIAATNRDLPAQVRAGAFREDLFYRLAVVQLALPPLAEHPEDIPLLAARFVERQRLRTGKEIAGLAEAALAALAAYPWPGNARELENAIEHAFVVCPGGLIGPEHLPGAVTRASPTPAAPSVGPIERAEADAIRESLGRHGGNRLLVARELGMHRSTLWRKIRQYRIR